MWLDGAVSANVFKLRAADVASCSETSILPNLAYFLHRFIWYVLFHCAVELFPLAERWICRPLHVNIHRQSLAGALH
jgi:hypothetical protein